MSYISILPPLIDICFYPVITQQALVHLALIQCARPELLLFAAVRALRRTDQEGLGHIYDCAVCGFPLGQRAVGTAAAIFSAVDLHCIPRTGLEVFDAV